MIKVYFESGSHSQQVATFENEETYIACLPALEKLATDSGRVVTESNSNTLVISEAKHILKEQGFYVGKLLHVDDVKKMFNVSNDTAMLVLENVLSGDMFDEYIQTNLIADGVAKNLPEQEYIVTVKKVVIEKFSVKAKSENDAERKYSETFFLEPKSTETEDLSIEAEIK